MGVHCSFFWPDDCAVLVPVYNHVGSVDRVVRELIAAGARVYCVDDGSSDGSGEAAAAAGAVVFRQASNGGKGLALQRGFRELISLGWRRVCTVDADGQHPISATCTLVQAANTEPQAIWVGARRMPAHAPTTSRLGRALSNFWTRIACGTWPGDAQCGLRVYPLPEVCFPRYRAQRYSFEVEVLIRCRWAGIALRHIPVEVIYPQKRISHFSAFWDSIRTGLVFSRLIGRAALPWPQRKVHPQPWSLRRLFSTNSSPSGLAAAAALGGAMGVSPIMGIQTLIIIWLCYVLRLNMPVAVVVSNISFGPLMAVWAALSISIGHMMRWGGEYAPVELYQQVRTQFATAKNSSEHWAIIEPLIYDWLWGSLIVMPAVAALCAGIIYVLSSLVQRRARATAA
ncbi:MAG: DUF2062 domain-containing protein [Planctomycetota bacterium]|nr:MAG: DUF2062 domain-containing protein [Planctomycetota bacterium]